MTMKAELLMCKHTGAHMQEIRVGSYIHLTCHIYFSSKIKVGRSHLLNGKCASIKPQGLFTVYPDENVDGQFWQRHYSLCISAFWLYIWIFRTILISLLEDFVAIISEKCLLLDVNYRGKRLIWFFCAAKTKSDLIQVINFPGGKSGQGTVEWINGRLDQHDSSDIITIHPMSFDLHNIKGYYSLTLRFLTSFPPFKV